MVLRHSRAWEHLTLLVANESVALTLLVHFGSIKALSRASLAQLRRFLPRRKAETVIAAFAMSSIAESEHALSTRLDNPESVYRACADEAFNQEVLRVILLDNRYAQISTVEVSKGPSTSLSPIPARFCALLSFIRLLPLLLCTILRAAM
jgi:DNA repair protein RadC